jgi:ankyrin repeat protein
MVPILLKDRINVPDDDGRSPLHIAIERGVQRATIDNILEQGAIVDAKDHEGNTPLMEAVRAGSLETVKLLAESGANIMTRNKQGDTPLHLAVGKNRNNIVTWLLDRGASIHAKNNSGETPLTLALGVKEFSAMVPILLKERINEPDDEGRSPLHIAIKKGAPVEMIAAFLKQGAKFDKKGNPESWVEVDKKDDWKTWARIDYLKWWVTNDEKDILKKWAKIHAVDHAGNTPLMEAVNAGSLETATLLAEFGANVKKIQNKQGDTPLHFAVKAVKSKEDGRDLAAFQRDQRSLVTWLLEQGASIHEKNNSGDTPFTLALDKFYPMVSILLTKEWINKPDKDGYFPLHIAIEKGAPVDMIGVILSLGADISAKDRKGYIPLRTAVEKAVISGNWETVELLVEKGSDSDLRSSAKDGKTPAEIATRHGRRLQKEKP